MKLQVTINDTYKGIKIIESTTFSKVIEALDNMFPNGSWKEFTLEATQEVIYWNNPLVYPTYPSYPTYPWYVGGTSAIDVANTMEVTANTYKCYYASGIYNVEIGE